MVKKAVLLSLIVGFVFAITPEQIAVNLGGAQGEVKSFVDENGNADIYKISQSLQEVGKLKLLSEKKIKTVLNFNSNGGGALLLKSVENMLLNLGFSDYQNLKFINGVNSSYSVVVNLDGVPNPGEIYRDFKKSSIAINNVVKNSDSSFTYSLDTSKASIYTDTFGSEYKKPIKPYFINVSGKSSILISAQSEDVWHPDIKIFDFELNLLESKRDNEPEKSINFILPPNSHYIQVDDSRGLDNIQKGLKFELR